MTPVNLKFNCHTKHNPSCDILEMPISKDSFITYGAYVNGPDKGKEFFEYYYGVNYVVGSNMRSHSRIYYSIKDVPKTRAIAYHNLRSLFRSKYLK